MPDLIPEGFTEQKRSLSDLITQGGADDLPHCFEMAKRLNIDAEEFRTAVYTLAKNMVYKPHRTQYETLISTIGWGIVLGYYYAKKEKPIILPGG